MAAIGYRLPSVKAGNQPNQNPQIGSLPVTSAQTINLGDPLILGSGTVESSGSNPSGALIGLALHDSGAFFAGGAAGSTVSKYSTPFGAFTSGFNLPETSNMHFVYFNNGNQFEFSLKSSTSLAQTLVGTEVGLQKDGTTGYYYVDTGASNKVATIVEIVQGPETFYGTIGTDTGGRVIVEFLPSALAV
jgi:hypothetical protein